ncbi:hypothetical protein GQ43DRAFT_81748 [Delitschia confertaspora ATCC 74209]|uniref:Uncharacterized protein n=1 Tax=Delitschia confertaspora ATCC 74209 TaxID=1513339 RepID=A0A9P4MP61_9PLEO|nr:hypothetical protein GQ43DRAFT_81748 [Delitschia confertaspora ATCC 74209]
MGRMEMAHVRSKTSTIPTASPRMSQFETALHLHISRPTQPRDFCAFSSGREHYETDTHPLGTCKSSSYASAKDSCGRGYSVKPHPPSEWLQTGCLELTLSQYHERKSSPMPSFLVPSLLETPPLAPWHVAAGGWLVCSQVVVTCLRCPSTLPRKSPRNANYP